MIKIDTEPREIFFLYKKDFTKKAWLIYCIGLNVPTKSEEICIEYVRTGINEDDLKGVSDEV